MSVTLEMKYGGFMAFIKRLASFWKALTSGHSVIFQSHCNRKRILFTWVESEIKKLSKQCICMFDLCFRKLSKLLYKLTPLIKFSSICLIFKNYVINKNLFLISRCSIDHKFISGLKLQKLENRFLYR